MLPDAAADIPFRIRWAKPADVERASIILEEALPAQMCRPEQQSTAGLRRIRETTATRRREAAAVATLPFRPEGQPSITTLTAEALSTGVHRRQALRTAVLTLPRKAIGNRRDHTTTLRATAARVAA